MSTVLYPPDLIPKIKEVWGKRTFGRTEKIPALPNDSILNEILNSAFHASLLTEEQRKIGFRLVYSSKTEMEAAQSVYSRMNIGWHIVVFPKARDFSISEILRLAPATDLTRIMICVDKVTTKKGGSLNLKIWGLIDTGSSWWDFLHGD